MALNSIHFSFNRNQNLVTGCCFHLNIYYNHTRSARKTCRMNVKSEEIINFANIYRMCFWDYLPSKVCDASIVKKGQSRCWPDCWPNRKVTLKIKIGLDEDRINYVSDNFCRRIRVRNVQNVQNVYDLHSECWPVLS